MTYFEFEIIYIDKLPRGTTQKEIQGCFLLNIKDVTHLVKSQQRLSDSIYQEAIESNFSNQQMTPLTVLRGSPKMINEKVMAMFKRNQLFLHQLKNYIQGNRKLLNSFEECISRMNALFIFNESKAK